MAVENPIKISIKQNNIATLEGNTSTLTISLNQASTQSIKVVYYLDNNLSDSTITDQDFKNGLVPNGILEFKAGETSKTISMPFASDGLVENLEKFVIQFVSLSPNATLETSTITELINDNSINSQRTVSVQSLNTSDFIEGDTFNLSLKLDKASDSPISIDYLIRPQTTTLTKDDFSNYSQTGTITFNAGQTEKTFSLQSVVDSLNETDEKFIVDFIAKDSFISIPSASQSIPITLKNNNLTTTSRFSLDNVSVSQTEGKSFDFKLKLDKPNTKDIIVKYNIKYITDGLIASDFITSATTGTITFKAGQTEQTLSITSKNDTIIESDEIFKVDFSSDSTALLFNESSAYGVILNDDSSSDIISQLSIMPEMVTQAEGQVYKYIINLDRPNTHDITIQYKINAISSTLTASDFGSADLLGSITFKAGEQQKTIEITPIIDTQIESNEAFSLDLSSDSPYVSLKSSSSISTIQDSTNLSTKPKVTATVQQENVAEGQSFVYDFKLDKVSDSDVTINYAIDATNKNVTASDFGSMLPAGTVVIPAGETSKTLSISTVSDTALGESDEAFYLMLWSNQSTIQPTTSIKGTILNSASPIEISKLSLNANAEVIEGDDINYTLQLDKGNAREITVNYQVVPISPNLNGDDFSGKLPSGSITFAPNETKKTLTFSPVVDNLTETNGEVYILQLGSASPYLTFEKSIVETTILDQKGITGISNVTFDKVSLTQIEGMPFKFDINLSQPQTETVSMTYDVIPISTNLTEDDFENNVLPSGTIAFKAGETQKSIQINTLNDGIDESTEYFSLKLHSNSPSLSLLNSSSVGGILNNNNPPTLTITSDQAVLKEGNAFNYLFKLNHVSEENISVKYIIKPLINSLTENDFSNVDFTGTVLIKAGQLEKTLTLPIAVDNLVTESNESFKIDFETESTVILNTASIQSTIQNNDELPIRSRLSITTDNVSQPENSNLNYTLSLDKANNQTILVDYQVTPISDELNADDFYNHQLPSGTITFAPNETSKSLSIRPLNDLIEEDNEAFVIHLSSKSAILDFDSSAITGIIANDDLNPTYSKLFVTTNQTTVEEGDFASYIFTLDKAQSEAITINYAIQSDLKTLTANDFDSIKLPSGNLVFKAGETQKRLNLPIKLDDQLEKTEYFSLQLTNQSPLISLQTSAITTKIQDIYYPTLTLSTTKEKLSEGSSFEYTLKLDKALSEDVTVNYHIEAISSKLTADDFNKTELPQGTLTFKAGETTKQLAFASIVDDLNENNELFKFVIDSDSSAFRFYNQSITSTLMNTAPTVISVLSVSPQSQITKEGDAIRYTLKLDEANTNPIDINYQVVPNTDNLNSSDFLYVKVPSGTIHFDAGQTEQTLTFYTLRDLLKESDEQYHIEFTSHSLFALVSNTDVLGTIQDNNKSIIGYSSDLSQTEGSVFKYTLSLDQANDLPFTVHYEVQPVTESLNAIDFADKKLPKGDITFNAGELSKSFTINSLSDLTSEIDERFVVNLSVTSNNDNVILGTNKLYGTIQNDDIQIAQLNVSSSTNIVYEGKSFNYKLNLAEANLNPVTVRYTISTENIPNQSFGVSDNNFKSTILNPFEKTGLITFNPGETTKTISFATVNDEFTNYDLSTSNHSANRYFNFELTPVTTNISVNSPSIQSILLDNDAFTPITLTQNAVTTSKIGISQITRLSSESLDDYLNDPTMNKIDISANNQFVVYATMDNNLLADDTSPFADIIRFNLNSKAYERVVDNAIEPTISADGNKVLFTSYNNLLDNQFFQDTNGLGDVFLKDMTTNSTQLISVINGKTNATNIQGDDESYSGTLSHSGDFVTFLSKATTLAKDLTNEVNLFAKNLKTNELKQIQLDHQVTIDDSLNYSMTQLNTMSSNGYFVFSSSDDTLIKNDTNKVADIFMQNMKTGDITLISTGSNGDSTMPTISNDGRFVVFSSKATNLTGNDMNGNTLDIFVKDTQNNKFAMVSTKSNGVQGDNASVFPTISSDGHYIAFSSQNDLVDDAQEGGRYITINPLWEDVSLNGIINSSINHNLLIV